MRQDMDNHAPFTLPFPMGDMVGLKGEIRNEMSENEISKVIVDAAIEVHRTLGEPGILEAVYEEALAFELEFGQVEKVPG